MLTLPAFPPRRAWIWAFWLAFSLSAGVSCALLLAATISWQWVIAAPAIAGLLLFAGWIDARIVEYPYRAWNKLAREFTRVGRLWVLAVLYYGVFMPVGWAGSLMRVAAPKSGESLWTEHSPFCEDIRFSACGTQKWLTAYLSWCRPSRNRWAIWLVPFLLLLTILETEEQTDSVPTNTYTLY
jgi:hypothetical protein